MSLAPPKLTIALKPGRKLDRYELLCPIAEGGMGVCWLARYATADGGTGLAALKTMKTEYATDPEFERMFLDEARISSGIAHPNVARILEQGEHDEVLYLAMEYVDGDSLLKLRREVTAKDMDVPLGIVSRILADTLGGLHAAHELVDATGQYLNVVHRDVSPQNILVSTTGMAKLIDFGIAKARDRSAGETSTGTIKGKLHFMAPEQALGKRIDRRADVFSVGAILYFMLSGRYAYHGETQAATILALAQGAPPEPLPASVPPAIAAVVTKALAYDPLKRYQSAAEMQQALESAMIAAGIPTTTAEVGAFVAQHLGHRAEKRRQAIGAAIEALGTGGSLAEGPLSTNTGAISGIEEARAAAAARLHTDPSVSASVLSGATPPSRSPVFLVVGAFSGLALVAGIALIVVAMQRRAAPNEAAPAAAPIETTTATAPTPAVESAVPVTTPPAPTPSASVAAAVPSASASAPKAKVTAPAPWPPPAASQPKKKKRVDDGF